MVSLALLHVCSRPWGLAVPLRLSTKEAVTSELFTYASDQVNIHDASLYKSSSSCYV